jgi:His-Xaa-Ser system radical SAM maturase HxsC
LRQLKGIPINSEDRIIGKVVINRGKIPLGGKNSILITDSLNDRATRHFKAILISNRIEEKYARQMKVPIIHSIQGLETLCEGDVLSLDMSNGIIYVEYEKQSLHNSILATNDCNCRCIMCPQHRSQDTPDSMKHNLRIVKLMDTSTVALGITGGEPTILKDGLIKILKQCRKCLPKTQIQLLTNGILLRSTDYVKKIARLGTKNLIFCIPIYADTNLEHDFIMQRSDAFEDTVLALYNLAAYKQLVEIRTVIMAQNYRRLLEIAHFIYRNFPFVFHVAFMALEVEGLAKKNFQRLWVSPRDYAPFLRSAVLYLSQRGINVSIYNEQLCLLPEDIWGFTCKSISEWKNIYLEECSGCREKSKCGGFFASPPGELRKQISPI